MKKKAGEFCAQSGMTPVETMDEGAHEAVRLSKDA